MYNEICVHIVQMYNNSRRGGEGERGDYRGERGCGGEGESGWSHLVEIKPYNEWKDYGEKEV